MPNPIGRALRNRRAGHHTLLWAQPEFDAASSFELSSQDFAHGAHIPERHRGRLRGVDLSPSLAWSTPLAGTVELLLVVQDPDVPGSKSSTHVLSAGIPPELGVLREGDLAKRSPVAKLIQGKGALGHRGWAGPAPIPSHGPHSYVFQLFAVDRALGLSEGFTLADATRAASGHVISRARLDGSYEIA